MYLCDSCAASLVIKKFIRPSGQIYGANRTPFKRDKCEYCGKEDTIFSHPEATKEMFKKEQVI